MANTRYSLRLKNSYAVNRKADNRDYPILEWFKAQLDPFLPVAFLQTGQSAKSRFCELEGYKAAIDDLTQSAILPTVALFKLVAGESPRAAVQTLALSSSEATSAVPDVRRRHAWSHF